MAKRGTYKGPCPAKTRELTGEELELDKARKWLLREKRKPNGWQIVRVVARVGLLEAYRAWIDAGSPG